MLNLKKFKDNYVLKIQGLTKDIYEQKSYELSLKNLKSSSDISFLNKEFTFKKSEKIDKDYLTNLVTDYLRKELDCSMLFNDWIEIASDGICIFITIDKDGNFIRDVHEAQKNGIQMFTAHFSFELSINGVQLEEEDLTNIFKFVH